MAGIDDVGRQADLEGFIEEGRLLDLVGKHPEAVPKESDLDTSKTGSQGLNPGTIFPATLAKT